LHIPKCGRLQISVSTETLLGWTGMESTVFTLDSENEVSLQKPDTIRLHNIDS